MTDDQPRVPPRDDHHPAPRPDPDDPRTGLAAALASVVDRLPVVLPEALALDRFRPATTALARLADPAWQARAVAACTPGEAGRLDALLRARWAGLVGDELVATSPRAAALDDGGPG